MKQKNLKLLANNLNIKILKSKNFSNKPFKHVFIDDFLPKKFASLCEKSFPKIAKNKWEYVKIDKIEKKYRSLWTSEFDIPENIVDLIRILNSSLTLRVLSKLFNMPKLLPDPYFMGGGLNLSEKGGALDTHIDGNYNDETGLNRRLNAIIYLTKDWKSRYGGSLGFYNYNGKKLVKKIEPKFNRIVVFNTNDLSYHGIPDNINYPKNNPRKSIILYYYTKSKRTRSETRISKPHSAIWVNKKYKDHKNKKTRKYY